MNELVTVIGARPQFIKASVVSRALKEVGLKESIMHTGQHYDASMSRVFWTELELDPPVVNLGVGSGRHGEQTAQSLSGIEQFLLDLPVLPAGMIVYGDTNSTLAGALAAGKLHIPVFHVEAGLRSYNREMPEEINRVITDHLSDLLFCSSKTGVEQLAREGITEGVHIVGDVMYDAMDTFSDIAERRIRLDELIPFNQDEYYLATVHRPSNTDRPEHLDAIIEAFGKLDKPVVWPVHPRNKHRLSQRELPANLHTLPPASYFEMLVLLKHSEKVLTDSGGVQKEAYWMKKPCITLRDETEWVETLNGNWNRLVGPDTDKIVSAAAATPNTDWHPLYGDGAAAGKIVRHIKSWLTA